MKRFVSLVLLLVLIVSLALPAQAALDLSKLLKGSDLLGGYTSTTNGQGTITWECSFYSGNLKNGLPYGKGTFYYNDGTCVSGSDWDWTVDEYSSWVPKRKGADMYYTGMTLDGEFCGYGKLEFNAGGTFQGEFEDGDPHGWGIYTYRSPKSEKKSTKESDNWKTLHKNKAHDHTYTGLAIGKTWQGFGIGITSSKYAYCGEIVDNYRDGHGELYTAKDKLHQWGIYRKGAIKTKYKKP